MMEEDNKIKKGKASNTKKKAVKTTTKKNSSTKKKTSTMAKKKTTNTKKKKISSTEVINHPVNEKNKKKETTKENEEIKESIKKEKLVEKMDDSNKLDLKNLVIDIEQEPRKTKKKSFFKRHLWLFLIIFLLFLSGGFYWFYIMFIDILEKNVYVELGTNMVSINQFFKREVAKNSSFVTDMNTIDYTTPGDYNIEIQVGKEVKTSMLHIIDTTSPKVEFQDVYAYVDYSWNPEDFVVSKEDLQEMTVKEEKIPEINGFGDYPVTIIVRDASGNETKEEKILHIGVLKTKYSLELGTTLKKNDLLYNEKDQNLISDEDIKKINESGVGEYVIQVALDGKTFTSTITVQDTLAPQLELKELTIYNDVQQLDISQFITKIQDASSYTTTLKTEIQYGSVGEQEITIEAKDIYSNVTEQKTKLYIIKDTVAPSIYGLTNMTVAKYTKINYSYGVSAYDQKDGAVAVQVNSSAVNVNAPGTYYATYTAVDKAGNKRTAKRKITVKHDQSDVNNKINSIASGIGSSITDVYNYVKTHIRYNSSWGDDDATWYGITNWRGNCYVQSSVVIALLQAKGYQAKMIWTTDKFHYWVIVNTGNGVWRHVDTTYSMLLVTDEERHENLKGRDWDRTLWPEAK